MDKGLRGRWKSQRMLCCHIFLCWSFPEWAGELRLHHKPLTSIGKGWSNSWFEFRNKVSEFQNPRTQKGSNKQKKRAGSPFKRQQFASASQADSVPGMSPEVSKSCRKLQVVPLCITSAFWPASQPHANTDPAVPSNSSKTQTGWRDLCCFKAAYASTPDVSREPTGFFFFPLYFVEETFYRS